MKIEDEIKQKKFKDEIQKLIINQLFTGRWVNNIISKQLKPFDLTTQQYNVLRILRGQKDNPISINDISVRMIDKMSNVSRLIDKLVNKGYISRKVNREDRRQVDIRISESGLEIIQQIENKEDEMKQHFESLTEDEARQLNDLLDKLRG